MLPSLHCLDVQHPLLSLQSPSLSSVTSIGALSAGLTEDVTWKKLGMLGKVEPHRYINAILRRLWGNGWHEADKTERTEFAKDVLAYLYKYLKITPGMTLNLDNEIVMKEFVRYVKSKLPRKKLHVAMEESSDDEEANSEANARRLAEAEARRQQIEKRQERERLEREQKEQREQREQQEREQREQREQREREQREQREREQREQREQQKEREQKEQQGLAFGAVSEAKFTDGDADLDVSTCMEAHRIQMQPPDAAKGEVSTSEVVQLFCRQLLEMRNLEPLDEAGLQLWAVSNLLDHNPSAQQLPCDIRVFIKPPYGTIIMAGSLMTDRELLQCVDFDLFRPRNYQIQVRDGGNVVEVPLYAKYHTQTQDWHWFRYACGKGAKPKQLNVRNYNAMRRIKMVSDIVNNDLAKRGLRVRVDGMPPVMDQSSAPLNSGILTWDAPIRYQQWMVKLIDHDKLCKPSRNMPYRTPTGALRFGQTCISIGVVEFVIAHLVNKDPDRWSGLFPTMPYLNNVLGITRPDGLQQLCNFVTEPKYTVGEFAYNVAGKKGMHARTFLKKQGSSPTTVHVMIINPWGYEPVADFEGVRSIFAAGEKQGLLGDLRVEVSVARFGADQTNEGSCVVCALLRLLLCARFGEAGLRADPAVTGGYAVIAKRLVSRFRSRGQTPSGRARCTDDVARSECSGGGVDDGDDGVCV